MSSGFRVKERPSRSDQILEELRKKLDKDKAMFFERLPNPPSFRRAGFPFDDDELTSRTGRPDFRHRLEELAQQHPEFADSLRPWYTETPPPNDMGWNFRQRTGSGSGSEGPNPRSEKVSTPQPEVQQQESAQNQQQPGGLPQHGLRNTVDIGEAQQAQAQMEEAKDERGKRAQSAPPDNPSKEPQRFVSRLDITPAPGQAASQDPSAAKPPAAPKQQPQSQPAPASPLPSRPASNVRQIPIFVEGRDEPVMAKHSDGSPSASNFGQPFGHHSFGSHQGFGRTGGGIHDNIRFGDAPRYTSSMHHNFNPQQSEPHAQKRPFPQQPQQQAPPSRQPSRHPPAQQPKEATPPPPAPKEAPKPREQTKPKDALEKVREVQQEVEALAEQVQAFSGARNDKQYIYLDEMLTRNLIKLDVIETEGREDVRAARKETIRSIQKCISQLESMTMPPEEQQQQAMETESASAADNEVMEAEPGTKTESASAPPPSTQLEMEAAPSNAPAPASAASEVSELPTSSASPPQSANEPLEQQPMDTTPEVTASPAADVFPATTSSSVAPESS